MGNDVISKNPYSKKSCNLNMSYGTATFPPNPSLISEGETSTIPSLDKKRKSTFTLVEGAAHAAHSQNIHLAAFTLSEVLITLGVIGVVAALTMPSLIANYQRTLWLNQLKKTYATLNEGFRQIMVNDGCTDMLCSGLVAEFDAGVPAAFQYAIYNDENRNKIITTFKLSDVQTESLYSNTDSKYNYFIRYLNGKDAHFKYPIGSNNSFIGTTPDGAFVSFGKTTFWGYQFPILYFDTNGLKGPNIFGRDIFSGYLVKRGIVTPMYSPAYYEDVDYPNSNKDYLGGARLHCSVDSNSSAPGSACLDRIILEGWQMNY